MHAVEWGGRFRNIMVTSVETVVVLVTLVVLVMVFMVELEKMELVDLSSSFVVERLVVVELFALMVRMVVLSFKTTAGWWWFRWWCYPCSWALITSTELFKQTVELVIQTLDLQVLDHDLEVMVVMGITLSEGGIAGTGTVSATEPYNLVDTTSIFCSN